MAQAYMGSGSVDGEEYLFMRAIFVPLEEMEDPERFSESDQRAFASKELKDKPLLFDVVYDFVSELVEGPVRVTKAGDYLMFSKKKKETESA